MLRLLTIALLTLATTGMWAADAAEAIKALQTAMGKQDATAKKKALAVLGDKSVGKDDDVLPLLVSAVGDRQAAEFAVAALRRRTGLVPSPNRGAGGYPAYPPEDTAAAWGTWLSERTKAKAIEDALKKKDEKPAAEPEAAPVAEAAPAAPKAAPVVDPDLGAIDRVIFTSGGALRCYVLSKRSDSDGHLISVRIAHVDGGGEEVLQADLIARLEEDIE